MGTINYGSNNYVVIGCNPDSWDDDRDEFDSYEEWDDRKNFEMQDDYDRTKEILNDYSFNNFKVTLELGYYEGFYIDIKTYFNWCLDSYKDRKEINSEVSQIKELLIRLVNEVGLCSVWPGWCVTYRTREETFKDINEGIKKLRVEVKKIPTYRQWAKLPDELKWC